MEYRDLQKLCKEQGLSAKGKTVDLEARLGIDPEPQFAFTGDPNDSHNPAWISMYGYMFKLGGAAIKVKDSFHANKLAGNSHFTEK